MFVYVGDETPDFINEPGSLPPIERTASLLVTGDSAPSDTWSYEVIQGTLEESVLVESGETLWLGVMQATQPSGIALGCQTTCQVGDRLAEGAAENLFFRGDWTVDSGGWSEDEGTRPLFSVTLGI